MHLRIHLRFQNHFTLLALCLQLKCMNAFLSLLFPTHILKFCKTKYILPLFCSLSLIWVDEEYNIFKGKF